MALSESKRKRIVDAVNDHTRRHRWEDPVSRFMREQAQSEATTESAVQPLSLFDKVNAQIRSIPSALNLATEVEPLPDEPLPDPTTLEWGYSRGRDGSWKARVGHEAAHESPHPWIGAGIVLKSREGRERLGILGQRSCGGPGWSLWDFLESNGKRDVQQRDRFNARGASRGIEGALDTTPCGPAERPAIMACFAATMRLCDCDLDRARDQNGIGWRKGDHSLGSMILAIPADIWSKGTLRVARRLLLTYSKTQIPDLWAVIEGGED